MVIALYRESEDVWTSTLSVDPLFLGRKDRLVSIVQRSKDSTVYRLLYTFTDGPGRGIGACEQALLTLLTIHRKRSIGKDCCNDSLRAAWRSIEAVLQV